MKQSQQNQSKYQSNDHFFKGRVLTNTYVSRYPEVTEGIFNGPATTLDAVEGLLIPME